MRLALRRRLPVQGEPIRLSLPSLQRTPAAGSTRRSFSSSSISWVMVPSSLTVRSSFIGSRLASGGDSFW
ncbi:hypothetical protein D3C76_812900 [compost metagenome]